MLKLAKTTGGSNGSPEKCMKCGDEHFRSSGSAWYCCGCGLYVPTLLSLKQDVKNALNVLQKIKKATNELEELVKE